MKRASTNKLSLNRETLVSLSANDLSGVNGGDIGPGGTSVSGTLTSKIGCPSRLPTLCPTNPGDSISTSVSIPTSRRFCPQGQ